MMEKTVYGIIDENWIGLATKRKRKDARGRDIWVVKRKEKEIRYSTWYNFSANSPEEYLKNLENKGMLIRNCKVI